MAIDPRRLRPSECCRLLNSTPLGEVINERQLLRHRTAAGVRLGDKQVDLLAYVAWLIKDRHEVEDEPNAADQYQDLKERARARNAALSLAGRDIGELPAVVNPDRKAQAARNFRFFCDAYFPMTFTKAWSKDHLQVITKMERSVLDGGLFAMAMPRGSGKTTICECACIWAIVYGHRDFVALIGADKESAVEMLDAIKMELDQNDLLQDDFPEVVFPIRALDGLSGRANGQLFRGERTHIDWSASTAVMPTIPGSPASGAIIKVAGITGRVRGMKYKRPDGVTSRPSLVIVDDPQTDESARSPLQCSHREGVLAGAVLGLAGPGKKIAGIMPCTVIRPGDMADNILSSDKHPRWNGSRTKMVYKFPTDEARWERYAAIRSDSFKMHGDIRDATEYYRQNRTPMDEGAEVAWPERYNHDELSALQHAMNIKLDDEPAFFAEYQNDPLPERKEDISELTSDQIAAKLNRMERGIVPIGATQITAFVDVQANMLFYTVIAWQPDFTGYVLEYGAHPDQHRPYYSTADARITLETSTGVPGLEGQLYAGLDALIGAIGGREWQRDAGGVMRINRILIDANWGLSTDVVYQFCRQSQYSPIVLPSHGRFVGASGQPFSEYRKQPGDRIGHNWRIPNIHGKRSIRHVLFDTNYWKSFVHARFRVAMGSPGCLSLFGAAAVQHRLFSDHLTAEYRVRTEGRGRQVDEWKIKPERRDNHWLDCTVGCAVAASIEGAALPDVFSQPARSNRRRAEIPAHMRRR